jgi:acyl-CoA thioester hydrolase
LRSVVELRVRYPETDQMGVVYHANYLAWCDIGRTELIRELGKSYAELEKEGLFLAVADASLRYHAPARYDDLVRVETWVEEVRSRTVAFAYLVTRAGGPAPERLITARTTLIALDRAGTTQKLPAHLVAALRGALPSKGAAS